MINIAPRHLKIMREILKKHVPGCEVRAFGSRVRGRARTYSDLPFRVEIMDWKAISAESRKVIEARYEAIQSAAVRK